MTSKNEKPNLDLIGMVQQARMQHDAGAAPSQMDAVYWIEAKAAPLAQQIQGDVKDVHPRRACGQQQ